MAECRSCRVGFHDQCTGVRCRCEWPLHVVYSPTPSDRVPNAGRPPDPRREADLKKPLRGSSPIVAARRRPGPKPRTAGGYRSHQDPARKPVAGRIRVEWAQARAVRQASETVVAETVRFLEVNGWSPAAVELAVRVHGPADSNLMLVFARSRPA